ncbi:hypothetical protein HDU76_006838, partial [Blyttiomyces sp. JEL0837]
MPKETKESRSQRVDHIINVLGLSRCADQIVGNPIQKGISGGQKRRVTLAHSLVTYPKILFLDEPTSGLDTTTSREVMASIKRIAVEQNMIVIATIHQPNFETLNLFTSLLLLAEGKVMYNGAIADMAEYFDKFGTPIPRFSNPADHAVDLVNNDFELREGDVSEIVNNLSKFYKTHNTINEEVLKSLVVDSTPLKVNHAASGADFWTHTAILSKRVYLNYTRNLIAYGVRLVHFFSVAFLSFMSVAGIPAFLEERSVFVRERHNGLYKTGPYVLANTLVNIPFLFICAFFFTIISYWAIGLNPDASAFFKFLVYLFLAIYAAESQVVLVSALLPIFIAALAIGAFMNGFWMCVQGYFIKSISLPRFWYYSFHFMDYQTYAFELLANTDMTGINFACAPNPNSTYGCQCAYPSSTPDKCTVSGSDVLSYLDINNISYAKWVSILVGIILIYRVLFYVVLLRTKVETVIIMGSPTVELKEVRTSTSTNKEPKDPLIFVDLGFSIQTTDGTEKVLLDGVTGRVQPGTMLAVMGPSGAGKSTFLDVISRRKTKGVKGEVYLGKKSITSSSQMSTVASYVEQQDDLLGVLTVRESISYAAHL